MLLLQYANDAFHFENLSLGQLILKVNYYESYVDFMCSYE